MVGEVEMPELRPGVANGGVGGGGGPAQEVVKAGVCTAPQGMWRRRRPWWSLDAAGLLRGASLICMGEQGGHGGAGDGRSGTDPRYRPPAAEVTDTAPREGGGRSGREGGGESG